MTGTSNTKSKILDATRQLLHEVGYESMSPAMVLERSGAGQGSLYHHFSGKEALALAVVNETADEFEQKWRKVFEDETLKPLEKIDRFLSADRNGILGCRLGRLSNEKAFAKGELHQPLERFFRLMVELVETALVQAVDEGQLPPRIPVRDIALMVVGSVQGGYVMSRALNDKTVVNSTTAGARALLKACQEGSV